MFPLCAWGIIGYISDFETTARCVMARGSSRMPLMYCPNSSLSTCLTIWWPLMVRPMEPASGALRDISQPVTSWQDGRSVVTAVTRRSWSHSTEKNTNRTGHCNRIYTTRWVYTQYISIESSRHHRRHVSFPIRLHGAAKTLEIIARFPLTRIKVPVANPTINYLR